MIFNLQTTLIATALSAAMAFSGGAYTGYKVRDSSAKNQELKHVQQTLETHLAITEQIGAAKDQANAALEAGRVLESNLRSNAAALRSANNSLRDATKAAVASAREAPQTCPDTAATLGSIFDSCSAEYSTLAEQADRHVIDVLTCHASP